jgi:SAM-dependent methyltransferase
MISISGKMAIKGYLKGLRDKAMVGYSGDIISLAEHNPGAFVLDLGCDNGEWTLKLGEKIGSKNLFGVEINADALEAAKGRGISVKPGDLEEKIGYPPEFFDVVHANQVIEHLSGTEDFVREVHRLLKPGGYAIICTENLSSWHNIISLLFGFMPMSSSNFSEKVYNVGNPFALHSNEATVYPKSWQHVRVLSIRGLKDIFTLHGFTVEKVLGSGYYPLPSFFGKIDPTHAAFITVKLRKGPGRV